jgi:hypothetical protein
MNHSSKFPGLYSADSAPITAAVPLQPMTVLPWKNSSQSVQSFTEAHRRNDDRLPIMIHAGDVVVIDGNHGHDYIDLRGYSVDDALFHGNTIEINKGTENHFVIQFKNVREAIFAGEVSVDL